MTLRGYLQFCLIVVSLLWSCLLHAKDNAFVENSNFEQIGECFGSWDIKCAVGFKANKSPPSSVSISTTANELDNRKLTFQFRNSKSDQTTPLAYVSAPIHNLESEGRYELSVWVKAEDFRGESLILVSSEDDFSRDGEFSPSVIQSAHGTSGYSTWMRVSMTVKVPDSSNVLWIALLGRAQEKQCHLNQCGKVHFDNISIEKIGTPLETPAVSKSNMHNVCSDGQFLDNRSGTCRPLAKQYGYVADVKTSSEINLDCAEISSSSLNASIRALGKVGGTIRLAPCQALLSDDVILSDNITISGAGIGRTVLFRDPNWKSDAGTLIRIEGSPEKRLQNVVLRDFTVRGSGPRPSQMNNIQIKFAQNVLVERIETRNAGKSGVSTRSSQQVTIRYVTGHSSAQWHGIESKDCYLHPQLDGDDENTLVSRDECSFGIRNFYTEDIAIYSNLVFNNNDMGIDSHASFAEIAGNIALGNGTAAKFPEPANNVWIHHNVFSDSFREGLKVALQKRIGDNSLIPFNQVIYRNIFRNNRALPMWMDDRSKNIFLIDNVYENNGNLNRIRIATGTTGSARLFVCPEDRAVDHGIQSSETDVAWLTSEDDRCDLDKVGQLF